MARSIREGRTALEIAESSLYFGAGEVVELLKKR